MAGDDVTFSFGENWEQFVDSHLTEERIGIAQEHLLGFLELPDLQGKYFLDVGCGSGLHSLAALKARAERIVSFDVDPVSVRTTEKVREHHGAPASWDVREGSILDDKFCAGLDKGDIVYAWGSLHHTGQMWLAVENAAALMKDDGLFYLALYTTTPRSGYWLAVKERYNRASPARKKLMESLYVIRRTIIPHLIRFKNPIKTISEYKKKRGMSYWTDVKDWLGGYPFEHAKIEDVLRFCRTRLGLQLINIKMLHKSFK